MSSISQDHIQALQDIISKTNILQPGSPNYTKNSIPWSLTYETRTATIVIPESETQLARLVKYLRGTKLDFAIRSTGCGNATAKDVIINMKTFSEIKYNHANQTVEVGAGTVWSDVDRELASQAPGRVVVGARCPYIGVAGSTLMGGLSWMSHELGLGSDPSNLLDVKIVLADGRAIWASTEPSLLWALRGGGGNFGVATTFRFKTHAHTGKIWAGNIQYKDSAAALSYLSKAIARFAAKDDPKMALQLFVVDFSEAALHGGRPEPHLVLLPYDAHGKAHALSEDGFGWALHVPGGVEHNCKEMQLRDVHELQRGGQATHGQTQSRLSAALVGEMDDKFVERCWSWYIDIIKNPETQRFGMGTFALLEIMQEPAMMNAGSPEATAWPHAALGRKNILQLSTGCAPGQSDEDVVANDTKALEIMAKAPGIISNKVHPAGHFMPNFALPNNDMSAIFGQNWHKLRIIKAQYDPDSRFNKGFLIPPA